MKYRILGRTGIRVSEIAFGAGPVSTLMVGENRDRQRDVMQPALDSGINWIDTAATYGNGQSERSLGQTLRTLGASDRVHVATKVRLVASDLNDIRTAVRKSLSESLQRLQLRRVTLLQLHNSLTPQREDEPTSITPQDVLSPGGVLSVFQELQSEGLVRHLGLTGIGNPKSLREVVRSGHFDTMQVPYHLLNPSAGKIIPEPFDETNYGNIIQDCHDAGMGVFAIRALAGGALADNEPSPHTLKTPFFPLALYERDRERARKLREELVSGRTLQEEAIRFVLAHPQVHSAIIGFGEPWQIDDALRACGDERR